MTNITTKTLSIVLSAVLMLFTAVSVNAAGTDFASGAIERGDSHVYPADPLFILMPAASTDISMSNAILMSQFNMITSSAGYFQRISKFLDKLLPPPWKYVLEILCTLFSLFNISGESA